MVGSSVAERYAAPFDPGRFADGDDQGSFASEIHMYSADARLNPSHGRMAAGRMNFRVKRRGVKKPGRSA
eukprot:9498351-Pyramimonas_sp.AAC.1